MLLPINPERVRSSFLNKQRVHHSAVRKIIHKWKTFRTVVNLPRSGLPSKFTPSSDCAMLRETATNPKSCISDSTDLG